MKVNKGFLLFPFSVYSNTVIGHWSLMDDLSVTFGTARISEMHCAGPQPARQGRRQKFSLDGAKPWRARSPQRGPGAEPLVGGQGEGLSDLR